MQPIAVELDQQCFDVVHSPGDRFTIGDREYEYLRHESAWDNGIDQPMMITLREDLAWQYIVKHDLLSITLDRWQEIVDHIDGAFPFETHGWNYWAGWFCDWLQHKAGEV